MLQLHAMATIDLDPAGTHIAWQACIHPVLACLTSEQDQVIRDGEARQDDVGEQNYRLRALSIVDFKRLLEQFRFDQHVVAIHLHGASCLLSDQKLQSCLIFLRAGGSRGGSHHKSRSDNVEILENGDAIVFRHLTALMLPEVDDFDLVVGEGLRVAADNSKSVLVTDDMQRANLGVGSATEELSYLKLGTFCFLSHPISVHRVLICQGASFEDNLRTIISEPGLGLLACGDRQDFKICCLLDHFDLALKVWARFITFIAAGARDFRQARVRGRSHRVL